MQAFRIPIHNQNYANEFIRWLYTSDSGTLHNKLMSADVSGAGRSFTLAAQNLVLAGNYIFSIVCYSLHANLTDKKLQTEYASKTCTETRN